MKQIDLANKTGILVSTLRQYELRLRKPKIDRVKVIADALEVPFECLLEFETKIFKEKTLADVTTEEIIAEMKRRIENDNIIIKRSHQKCIAIEK